mgnify:CR=1 FL=1
MINIFNEIGIPERIAVVKTPAELEKFINRYNKLTNVYISVYKTSKTIQIGKRIACDFKTAIINKIFLDFDSINAYEKMMIIHNFLLEKDIQHYVNFSGRGYHLYIKTKIEELKNPKIALREFTFQLAKKLGLTIGIGEKFDIDIQTVGDLSRITRVPNTFNIKRNKWCIPLSKLQILFGDLKIRELADAPNIINNKVSGTKLFSLKKFDKTDNELRLEIPEIKNYDYNIDNFAPCIRQILTDRNYTGWKNWYTVIVWLKESGFSKEETNQILKKYLSKFERTDGKGRNDYEHLIFHDKTLDYIYSNGREHFFPKCEVMMFEKNLCPGKCKYYNSLYNYSVGE